MANREHLDILKQGWKVWNQWRTNNPEIIPDIQKANLQGAKLWRADFRGVNLQEANLQEANFLIADLQGAYLRRANLQGAYLQGAYLRRANLQRANLQGANLTKSILIKANVTSAMFDEAVLNEANFQESVVINVSFKNATINNISFESVIIDRFSLFQLPENLQEQFSKTWYVIDNIQKDNITRCIEFPPEYHQAGISILNYFGTVLRKKFPDIKAKIRIEQDGMKVTMTIQPIEGESEVIERALNEYGLVITGNMTPEDFTEDKLLVIELKNELRNAMVRIESQKELLQYQDGQIKSKDIQIEKFQSIMDTAFQDSGKSPICVDVSPTIIVSPTFSQNLNFSHNIALIQEGLNELREQLSSQSEEDKQIQEVQDSLKKLEKKSLPKDIKTSSSMSKLRRFFEELNEPDSKTGKTIQGLKEGVKIVQKLAGYYNGIASWCGLPTIPKPFIRT